MTAVEMVQKLYEEIRGDRYRTTVAVRAMSRGDGDAKTFCNHPDPHDSDEHETWLARCSEINNRVYTRDRDKRRAYKAADLAHARAVDAANG